MKTKIILLIGEIGGQAEERAAEFIYSNVKKPVLSYISGIKAPEGKRMGHAGAIVSKHSGSADSKIKILSESGVKVVKSLPDIGKFLLSTYKSFYNIIWYIDLIFF